MNQEKQRAYEIAKSLLESNVNYLDHIIELRKIGNALYGQVWGTEFHIFGVIESDTDHLPTAHVREHCTEEWLIKADREIAECIEFYNQNVRSACREIIAMHGNS